MNLFYDSTIELSFIFVLIVLVVSLYIAYSS